MQSNWFQNFTVPNVSKNEFAPLRLYCLAHAGGSCQYFQPWAAKLPTWIQVVGVQLPGRWNRIQEKPFLRMPDLIAQLGPSFIQERESYQEQPFAFYGHSLGGLIAFELTRYLIKNNQQLPEHLFISAKRSLQLSTEGLRIYSLPDLQFERALTTMYGALPPEITEHDDIKKMFLDITKVDMELLDTYVYSSEPIVSVPLTILGGMNDHVVTLKELEPWQELSNAGVEILQFPGDHFFIRESQAEILNLITHKLQK